MEPKRRENIEGTIAMTFADLRRILDEYQQEIYRTEPPFVSFQYPDRIKARLKLISSLIQERHDALREAQT